MRGNEEEAYSRFVIEGEEDRCEEEAYSRFGGDDGSKRKKDPSKIRKKESQSLGGGNSKERKENTQCLNSNSRKCKRKK